MAGEVRIGGTNASVRLQGNDTIAADQTFTFPDSGGEIVVTPGAADIAATGTITSNGLIQQVTAGISDHWLGQNNSQTINGLRLYNASIASSDDPTNRFIECRARPGGVDTVVASVFTDGSANFSNMFFNLEPDNPQNYVSTTNAEGETEQVYSGPTLDVRQVVLDLQSKVEALQAEIQTLKGGAS